jgi:MFS family permease
MTATSGKAAGMTKDERFVILASSLGTVFEWYDFYLFGSLASIIGAQFFGVIDPATNQPMFNQATRDIFALLAFAAGFIVRPFGAIVFGRVGDIVGRKYTFLVTILIMGLSTFIVGILPNAATIGDLCRRTCPDGQTRLLHLVHPDHGHARPVPVAAGNSVHPYGARRTRIREVGLAHSVPGLGAAARHLGLDPVAAQ